MMPELMPEGAACCGYLVIFLADQAWPLSDWLTRQSRWASPYSRVGNGEKYRVDKGDEGGNLVERLMSSHKYEKCHHQPV